MDDSSICAYIPQFSSSTVLEHLNLFRSNQFTAALSQFKLDRSRHLQTLQLLAEKPLLHPEFQLQFAFEIVLFEPSAANLFPFAMAFLEIEVKRSFWTALEAVSFVFDLQNAQIAHKLPVEVLKILIVEEELKCFAQIQPN